MAVGELLRLILFPLYLFVWFTFGKIQSLWWRFSGTKEALDLASSPEGYSSSVHVQDIRMRYSLGDLMVGTWWDFITTHKYFSSPEVLLADDISLYTMTETKAVFVRTDSSVDVHNSSVSSFQRIAQYRYATQMLTMPLPAFHKFAEDLGNPKTKVLIVSNTARCGSTLLGQMFEATGEGIQLSEPWAFSRPCYFPEKFPSKEFNRVIINSVRVLCKPRMANYSCYVVKPAAIHTSIVPLLIKEMPEVSYPYDPW